MNSAASLGIGFGISALLLIGIAKAAVSLDDERQTVTVGTTRYEVTKLGGGRFRVVVLESEPTTSVTFDSKSIIEAKGGRASLAKLISDLPAIAIQQPFLAQGLVT
jgi:hypothetical protein